MLNINNNQKQNNNQAKYIEPRSEELVERWIELDAYKYILLQDGSKQDFAREEFITVLKLTWDYFQQLNTISSLPLCSEDSISFSSCLRVMDIMYQYASDKVFVSDCEYNNYEDLDNFHLAKLQISLKASQLITQSLCFAVSLIPKEKLSNEIGVVYNGTTIEYSFQLCNIEDIMKEVCCYPHSLC